MAHFAEIDQNNVVTRVLVVPDSEQHRGEEYLSVTLGLGGRWIQTSYNSNIRKTFAGQGYIYNEELDIFLSPKPYPSWQLDQNHNWRAPIKSPTEEECWYGEGEFVSIVEGRNYPINDPLIKYVEVIHPETGETIQAAIGRMPAVWNEELQQWRGLGCAAQCKSYRLRSKPGRSKPRDTL